MGRNFDPVATRYDEARGGEQRGDAFAMEIEPHLPANPDAPVLEVGVGTGVVAAALRRRGRRVVGVDIAIEMLRVASRRVPGVVARYDGWRLPFASGALDAGYLVWVIHLVEDQRALLREVARVLRPGGRLIVATINREPDDGVSRITEPMYRTLLGDRWARDDPDRVAGVASSVELREVRRVPGTPNVAETSGVLQAQEIEARNASVFWDLNDEAWMAHVAPVLDRLRAMGEVPVIREQTHEILVLEKG
jgi:ubiquinone/menaquinone biosynthesis C-methylase UbiE